MVTASLLQVPLCGLCRVTSGCGRWLVLFVASWAGLTHASLATGEDAGELPELTELISAHETTLGLIQSAYATVEHTPVGGRNRTVGHSDTWYKQGKRERFVRQTKWKDGAGVIQTSRTEMSLDWSTMQSRLFSIANEADIARMTETDHFASEAYTRPFHRQFLRFSIYGYFLLRFSLTASDDERSLQELIAEAVDVELGGLEMCGDQKCYVIRIRHPGVRGRHQGMPMRIYLDPAAGCLARKMVVEHENGPYVCEVGRFRDCDHGVFFPEHAEAYVVADGERRGVNRFVLKTLEINQQVSDADVRLRFPTHALVRVFDVPFTFESPPVETHLWLIGEDGEVSRAFQKGTDDYLRFMEEMREREGGGALDVDVPARPATGEKLALWLVVGLSVTLLALVSAGAIAWRRKR